MQKKIISIVLLVLCVVICAGFYCERQNKSEIADNVSSGVDDGKIPYVMDAEGNWVKYAFYETNDDYNPNEDYSNAVKKHFDTYIKDKYCYSHYAPHGDLWQISCYDTNNLCQQDLDKEIAEYMVVDAKKCYRAHLLDAWCISSVKTGFYRYYDDGTYGEILTSVCVKTESLCNEIKKFRFDQESECRKQVVLSNKNEMGYIWSDKDAKKLIEQNKKAKPLVFRE